MGRVGRRKDGRGEERGKVGGLERLTGRRPAHGPEPLVLLELEARLRQTHGRVPAWVLQLDNRDVLGEHSRFHGAPAWWEMDLCRKDDLRMPTVQVLL